jgi:hypothetical protein
MGGPMRRVGMLGLAIVLALSLAAVGTAGDKRTKSKTSATIDGYTLLPMGSSWSGEVASRKDRCERRRDVTVYSISEFGENLVGSGTSDRQGRWEFTNSQFVAVTEHRADVERRVIKKKSGKRLICKAGSSPEEIPSGVE